MTSTYNDMCADLVASPPRWCLLPGESSHNFINKELSAFQYLFHEKHRIIPDDIRHVAIDSSITDYYFDCSVYSCDIVSPRTRTKMLMLIRIDCHCHKGVFDIAGNFIHRNLFNKINKTITEFGTRMNNYIHTKQYDVITHPCSNYARASLQGQAVVMLHSMSRFFC